MRLHSEFEITCDCGKTHHTQETSLVCQCGRELVIQWREEKEIAPSTQKVVEIAKRKAVA